MQTLEIECPDFNQSINVRKKIFVAMRLKKKNVCPSQWLRDHDPGPKEKEL